MRKEKVKRRICYFGSFLAICLILYSCLKDESDWDLQKTSNGVIKGKNRELSLDAALSWYEANQPPVVSTRSVDTKFELLSKLHWKKGLESRKEKFEVVEVPLLNKGGTVLMDSETMEKYKETELGKIRTISRMVIIKNLETGEIINFIMHIIGTYEYLMTAKHFEENSYLYRDPHFSGSVYFYEPGGSLVNGWKYEDGKIVATIKQGTEEGMRLQTKTTVRGIPIEVCNYVDVLAEYNDCNPLAYEDPEYGLGIGIECRTKTRWETVLVCKDVDVDDGNSQTWYPEDNNHYGGGGGGTTGGYTPSYPTLDGKLKKIIKVNKNLSEKDLDQLLTITNQITQNRGDKAVYEYLIEKEQRFESVLRNYSAIPGIAGYDPNTGNLTFYDNGPIEYQSFVHEMFHLFQHKVRGNYQKEERGFMEYERNLYTDIIFFVETLKGNWEDYDKYGLKTDGWVYFGANGDEAENYKRWLTEITKGGTIIPTDITTDDFTKYAEFYGRVNLAYNTNKGYIYDSSIIYTPKALIEALTRAQ